jgi:KDO2-lipid IV(A) lauroyltransferase
MGKKKKKKRRIALPLHHPKLWPTWIAVVVFRFLCTNLSWDAQMALGDLLGRLCYRFIRFRRHVVEVNLALCFPEKSTDERNALALAHYQTLGRALFETGSAWWAESRKLPAFEIAGRENLESAVSRGKGVLLLTAHFTTLEICGRFLCESIAMGGLYRRPENPVVSLQMENSRAGKLFPAIEMNDLRGLIRALKDGYKIWYAPDQSRRSKFSTLLPFFGVLAQTNTATSRLAEMTGAAVVPFFSSRRSDGTYLIEILPALENFPGTDPNQDAVRTNQLMEEYIRKAPEQYFWIHRRFNRRGKQHPNVYRIPSPVTP